MCDAPPSFICMLVLYEVQCSYIHGQHEEVMAFTYDGDLPLTVGSLRKNFPGKFIVYQASHFN